MTLMTRASLDIWFPRARCRDRQRALPAIEDGSVLAVISRDTGLTPAFAVSTEQSEKHPQATIVKHARLTVVLNPAHSCPCDVIDSDTCPSGSGCQ
jgi:hypothetical protein